MLLSLIIVMELKLNSNLKLYWRKNLKIKNLEKLKKNNNNNNK